MKATKLILSIIFVLGISLVLDAKPALDPALLEGLDMKGVDSSMTPVGLIPYTQETSERWNRTIAERHGQNSPQLIFHIPRWVSLSEKYWQNHSPAVHAKAVLYPALVKVFSNPSSYLISGWDSSMIHDILMVTPDAVTSAPFK
ncbi:MAG: hypothetical protein HYY61_02370, partial [Deltaproteobacteria bacterium]|nr:hypothetical protein [Deltaproteobacteria bacterium]